MTQYTIVASKGADGITRVKFDNDPSEEAAHHRFVMIGHLSEQGHVLEAVPHCPIHGHHVILHSGPLKQ